MELGSSVIVTPIDNPCQFDPDWRNSVASAILDFPDDDFPTEYDEYRHDSWITRQVEFMRASRSGMYSDDRFRDLRLANIWYQGSRVSDVRFRLEPLLLTAASLDDISLDVGGGQIPVDAFKAYERLYFNIRTDDGRINQSCQLRQYFALPSGELNDETPPEQIWKMVGALMGYDTLTSVWLWTDAHGRSNRSSEYMIDEMWRVAQSRLFMHMFSDRVGNESLAKLLSAFTAQSKMLREDATTGQQGIDTTRTLMAILYKSRPQMVGIARDVDAQASLTSAIKARLESQLAVTNSSVSDAGPGTGVKAVQDRLSSVISDKRK